MAGALSFFRCPCCSTEAHNNSNLHTLTIDKPVEYEYTSQPNTAADPYCQKLHPEITPEPRCLPDKIL